MNRLNKRVGAALLAAALTVAISGVSSIAQAQGVGRAGGGFGGRGGVMMGGPMGANALRSNPMGLLQRVEVQGEIGLSLRQKQQIEALQSDSGASMRQKMQDTMKNSGFDPQAMRNLPQAERDAKMQEFQTTMQAAMTQFQGELDDKIKEILKPEQVVRLHELDLQKRGPMALADQKVADEIKLSPDSRTQIAQILAAYQQENATFMQQVFADARQNGQMPDFQNKLSPVKQKNDKMKKAAEGKIIASLTPTEKAAWKKAQGVEFTFRPDPPMLGGRSGFGGGNRGGGGFGGNRGGGGAGFGNRGGGGAGFGNRGGGGVN